MNGILGIDTASTRFAVAYSGPQGSELQLVEHEAGQDHSRLLLTAVRDVLGSQRNEVEAIVVITGPGSYAGIRVGVATAQALGFAWGVPVYGVGTLEAAAAAGPDAQTTIIHPAGRGEFAVQEWTAEGPATTIIVLPADELAPTTVLVGERAGALGGTEIGAAARIEAAIRLIAARPRPPGADVMYLREPNITAPRRPTTSIATAHI